MSFTVVFYRYDHSDACMWDIAATQAFFGVLLSKGKSQGTSQHLVYFRESKEGGGIQSPPPHRKRVIKVMEIVWGCHHKIDE